MPQQFDATPIPPDFAARLPQIDLLRAALLSNILTLQAGRLLVRAAWNVASIWPSKVMRTYRFGPPVELANQNGFPYHWIYAADAVNTAVWEAQFCGNEVTRPGTFFIQPGAENGLLATLSFSTPLYLLDLAGSAASRLGLYDQLRSPDHGWCQWLGCQLDQIIAQQNAQQENTVQGFRYPSRRHPGHNAYAFSSRCMQALGRQMTHACVKFSDSDSYARLLADPLRADPP